MEYKIRELKESELQEALDLIGRVFIEFSKDSAEGREYFKSRLTKEAVKEKIKEQGLFIWGAFDKDKMIGIIRTRQPFHIQWLFVDKQYHRQGIAKKLFENV